MRQKPRRVQGSKNREGGRQAEAEIVSVVEDVAEAEVCMILEGVVVEENTVVLEEYIGGSWSRED